MNQYKKLFFISHFFLLFGLILWFNPITHPFCQAIDLYVFKLLNNTLKEGVLWQNFWGILNHRKEALLNLALAALISILGILSTSEPELRKLRIKQTLYFWMCFQIGFMIQREIFVNHLNLIRLSPSLVVESAIRLSEIFNSSNIKDYTRNSFPGGHAFAMIYWASFTFISAPKRIGYFGIGMGILLCLPRLFSGAHWLSDVLFSVLLAILWLHLTLITPIYKMIMQKSKNHPTLNW